MDPIKHQMTILEKRWVGLVTISVLLVTIKIALELF